MATYTFNGYKGRATHRFTCPSCGKPKRTRTFTAEHTVNPFNKNADGTVRTASQVRAGAIEAAELSRAKFATAPLCASCEENLPSKEQLALWELRKSRHALSLTDGRA